jgi:hypothetical protein
LIPEITSQTAHNAITTAQFYTKAVGGEFVRSNSQVLCFETNCMAQS